MRQRGSILVPAALIILIGMVLLGGAQFGYFYYVKRELQKTADLVALTAVQVIDGSAASCAFADLTAKANVKQNLSAYHTALNTPSVQCYRWDPANVALSPRDIRAATSGERINAVQVILTLPVSSLLPFSTSRSLSAEAVAAWAADPVAAFWVRMAGRCFLMKLEICCFISRRKLLRVLEQSTVTRLGSSSEIPVSFRLVAATNKDLRVLVANGEFRADLYYRLAVIELRIPNLEARGAAEKRALFRALSRQHGVADV